MKPIHATLVALAAAASLAFSGCKDEPSTPEPAAAVTADESESSDLVQIDPAALKTFEIGIEPIQKHTLVRQLAVPAHVAFDADSIAHIASSVSGRILHIDVQVGSHVKKGDRLLMVDSPQLGEAQDDFLQKISVAQANRTRMEVARAAYERTRELYRAKASPLAEMQKLEGEYRTVQGELNSADTAVNAGRNKLTLLGMSDAATSELIVTRKMTTQFIVQSPISGSIIDRTATIGEVVGPDTEAILTVADMSTMWVIADVRESELGNIHIGDTARIIIESLKDKVVEGPVAYIAPVTNSQTFTGEVRISVRNPDEILKSGMFAQAHFDIGGGSGANSKPVLAVPDESVQTIDGVPCVFVPDSKVEGAFKKTTVKLSGLMGGYFPIKSGLVEGDRVVTTGSFILKAELGKGSVEEE